jgi:hypothetical protein
LAHGSEAFERSSAIHAKQRWCAARGRAPIPPFVRPSVASTENANPERRESYMMKRRSLAALVLGAASVLLSGAIGPGCAGDETTDCGNSICPTTGHPRLWLKSADLPRLQGWAKKDNPIWEEGMVPMLAEAEVRYSSEGAVDVNNRPIDAFFPPSLGGQPNPTWADDGTSGVGFSRVETIAQLFAFRSLMETDEKKKADYAEKAKKLLLYAMEKASTCLAPDESLPYCSTIFAYFNRANYIGEAWGLTVDWIYPYLTGNDKALIRKVFLKWAREISQAVYFVPNLDYVQPPVDLEDQNNTQLLSNDWSGNNQRQFRWSANNYYSGSTRNLAMMVLAFDEADDPPEDPKKPADALGNTLRSFIPYLFNVILYQQYAIYEDREKVLKEYGLEKMASSVDVGIAGGGLPPEGLLYGHSLGYVMQTLLAVHTAGYDDVKKRGPQAGFFASSYWDRVRDGLLTSIATEPTKTPSNVAFGSVYQMASYGDLLYFYVTDYDYIPLFSTLALRHDLLAQPWERDKELWAVAHAMPGGQSFLTKLLGDAFTNSGATTTILAFMALDPAKPLADYKDPRPSMPLTFYAKPLSRLVQRTSWGHEATMFDHICSWESINHQNGNCGQFQLHRKGEWLTTEYQGYDNPVYDQSGNITQLPYGYTSDYHNTISIQNDLVNVDLTTIGDDQKAIAERGSQWNNDNNAGDPVTQGSASDDQPYSFLQDEMTNLYNRVGRHGAAAVGLEGRATAVKHASRSMLWIKPDHVIVYDRAETGPQDPASPDKDLWKRFNLLLLQKNGVSPAVTQNAAGWVTQETTPAGQSLFVQTLLPAGIKPQLLPIEQLHPAAQLNTVTTETTMGIRLRVEDPGTGSRSVRFLHVLEGADAGKAQDAVSYVSSQSGVPFEGALITIGGTAHSVLFAKDLPSIAGFDTMSYVAKPASNVVYVVDLAPKTTYHVQTGGTVVVSASPQGGSVPMATDEGGVLRLAF